MGGRLDATNIINPLVSVVTNISYDHTEILGDTLEKIAVEKAGIIKEKSQLIVGERNKLTDEIFINRLSLSKNELSEFENLIDKNINLSVSLKKVKPLDTCVGFSKRISRMSSYTGQ